MKARAFAVVVCVRSFASEQRAFFPSAGVFASSVSSSSADGDAREPWYAHAQNEEAEPTSKSRNSRRNRKKQRVRDPATWYGPPLSALGMPALGGGSATLRALGSATPTASAALPSSAARTLASTSSSPFAVQSSPSTPVPARVPIRVGMLPFTLMPWLTYDTETNAYTTGFLPEFWRTVASLGCDLRPSRLPCFDIEFVPITDPDYTSNSTAVVRRWLLENKIDVGFDSDTHLYYDDTVAYTHPMAMSWTVGLLKKEKQEASFWEIFGPFTLELWVALLLSILFGSVVLQALSYIASDTKLSVVGFGNALYHTTAAVLGGDEYDLYHVAPLGRLYRMGLLFLILISSATYTANLAAFLTKPSIAIRGPRSMEALAESTACLRHAQYERYAQPFIRNKVVPPSTMSVYDRIEWAYGELASGNCDVIIENDVNARSEMLERCDSLFVDETVQFSPMYTFNLVRRNETQLALWLSEAIMVVMTQPVYGTILARTMKVGRSCEDNEEIGDTTPIGVTQMAGMFIVFGATGAIAVLVTLLDRCKTKKPRKPEDFEADVRDGMEKLEEKLESLQTELRGALAARGGSGGSGTGGGAPRGAGSSCVEHMMAPTAAGTNHGHDAGDEVVELQDVVAVEHAFDSEFENDHMLSGRVSGGSSILDVDSHLQPTVDGLPLPQNSTKVSFNTSSTNTTTTATRTTRERKAFNVKSGKQGGTGTTAATGVSTTASVQGGRNTALPQIFEEDPDYPTATNAEREWLSW